MAYETILVERRGGVAILTLNRPDKLNAMSIQLTAELDQALTEAEEDDEVAAIVVTGSGDRAFSAGADIHEMVGVETEKIKEMQRLRWKYTWHVATCTKPTIGALNGLAYGGGAMLASTLDMRVGCERSRFRFLAAQYGRLNSTWTLPHIVGLPVAMELLTTARVVEPEEAYRIGLLNRLVTADRVLEEAVEIGQIISQNHQRVVQATKRLLHTYMGMTWEQMFELEQETMLAELRRAAPVEEAFKGFLERRGN